MLPEDMEGYLYYIRLKTSKGIFYKIGFTRQKSVEDRFSYGGSKNYQLIDKVLFFKYSMYAYEYELLLHNHLCHVKALESGSFASLFRDLSEYPLFKDGQTELYKHDVLGLDPHYKKPFTLFPWGKPKNDLIRRRKLHIKLHPADDEEEYSKKLHDVLNAFISAPYFETKEEFIKRKHEWVYLIEKWAIRNCLGGELIHNVTIHGGTPLPVTAEELIRMTVFEPQWAYTDSIPQQIGNLTNLEKVIFPFSTIIIVPDELYTLKKLKILDLSYSEIRSLSCNIEKLQSLEELYLQGCPYIEKLPIEIEKLPNLNKIEVSEDVYDEFKKSLPTKHHLLVSNHYATRGPTIEEIEEKTKDIGPHSKKNSDAVKDKLDVFSIENLSDEFKSEWMNDLWRWADEHEIEEYNIPRNKIDLLNLEHLSFESISYFKREKFSILPKEIGKLINLKFLELGSVVHPEILLNRLTELPKEIGSLKELTQLYLQDNGLTELPKEICKLSKLKQLKLGFNQLKKLPDEIGNLKKLNLLTVWKNNLTELPKGIGLLTNLVGFDISWNPIKTLPDEITNLTNLKKFYFDCENIEFNQFQIEWLFELKNNGCELTPSDFLNSCDELFDIKQQNDQPPHWFNDVPPCDEIPPWITEKPFYEEVPPWIVDYELEVIRESFKNYGVTSLWHMTHIDNIESIVNKGILSNKKAFLNAMPVDISDHNVQKWRCKKDPIYDRELHDYVPTYFNVKNPMLFAKRDMEQNICLIEISLSILSAKRFIFTDGNAASKNSNFYHSLNDLHRLPWDVLNADYWNDFEDGKRKKCSEVLVLSIIPSKYIKKIYCSSWETLNRLSNLPVQSIISEELFFDRPQNPKKICEDDIPF